jgi:hypothetical protein
LRVLDPYIVNRDPDAFVGTERDRMPVRDANQAILQNEMRGTDFLARRKVSMVTTNGPEVSIERGKPAGPNKNHSIRGPPALV